MYKVIKHFIDLHDNDHSYNEGDILCEPYLMQMGFLTRTPRGRCATRLAYEHLGLKAPESDSAEDNGQQSLF